MTTSPSARSCGVLRALGPPDHLALDRAEFLEGAIHAAISAEDVIDLVRRDAVAQQGPFEIVDRFLLQRTLAGKLLEIEYIADAGRLGLKLVCTVAEGCRIDDIRDEAFGNKQVAEILRGGCAVRRRRKVLVRVDRQGEALVAKPHGVGGDSVDQIPGHVIDLVHGAQLGDRFRCGIVVDDLDVRIQLHIGQVVGILLAFRIGAAPRYDHQLRFRSRRPGDRNGCCADHDGSKTSGKFHDLLPEK